MIESHVPVHRGRSLIQVKVGDRVVDAIREPKCQTCMHPARMDIETLILQGHPYRTVAAQYSEAEWTDANGETITLPKVTGNSVIHHFRNGHMPVPSAAQRAIMERRAEQIGAAQYEQQTEQLVDQYIFARQVLTRTQERLLAGEIQPEVRDGIAAAKLIQDMESGNEESMDVEAWSEAVQRYFEIAQKFMPPDMWQHFTQALRTDPILKAISSRASKEDAIDAEIVDTEERD